jgi:hypothetical protein
VHRPAGALKPPQPCGGFGARRLGVRIRPSQQAAVVVKKLQEPLRSVPSQDGVDVIVSPARAPETQIDSGSHKSTSGVDFRGAEIINCLLARKSTPEVDL